MGRWFTDEGRKFPQYAAERADAARRCDERHRHREVVDVVRRPEREPTARQIVVDDDAQAGAWRDDYKFSTAIA